MMTDLKVSTSHAGSCHFETAVGGLAMIEEDKDKERRHAAVRGVI